MGEHATLLEEERDGVLVLTLSNPSLRNALHPDIYAAGIAAAERAAQDAAIGAIVLTGAGGHFCAGGNLNRLAANRHKPSSVQAESLNAFHRWIRALRNCPQPVIGAIEGNAVGAGFSLALACDLLVAAETARFGMAYVKVGLSPDGGASAHLAGELPRQLASELLLLGGIIDSRRLQSFGVVNRVVADGTTLTEALQIAQQLARGPRQAQQRVKRLLAAAEHNPLEQQLALEADYFVASLFGPEAEEGIAAFLAKRAPDFSSGRS